MPTRGAKKILAVQAPSVLNAGSVGNNPRMAASGGSWGTVSTAHLALGGRLNDCIVSGVILLDEHQRVQSASEEAQEVLGLPGGKMAFEFLPSTLKDLVLQAIASGQPINNRPVECTLNNGQKAGFRVSVVPIQPGNATRTLIFLSHLNWAGNVEEHIQQLDRLASLGTLATGMAHEIKNALVAGKTFMDLLMEKNQDAELAGVVRREMGRIDGMVNQMLKFGSPDKPTFSGVRLHEVLDQSLKLVQPQLDSRAIKLHRLYQAATDLVSGDDLKLEQAILNLLLNAIEAMGPHGELHVTTQSSASLSSGEGQTLPPGRSQLRIAIQDSGSGITPQNMTRLFQPFFTTKPNGTGLGLSITRRIIQEHQGEITVESEPHKGATFSILLPCLE